MKKTCKCAIKEYMSKCLSETRFEHNFTQDKLAELLMVNTRSYANLESGKSCCCTLTFVLYLVFCCRDVQAFADDLRSIILDITKEC